MTYDASVAASTAGAAIAAIATTAAVSAAATTAMDGVGQAGESNYILLGCRLLFAAAAADFNAIL